VVGVGDDSFVFAHEVYDDGPDGRVVYVRARTTLSPYLFAEGDVRALTDEEKAVLERFREDDPMPAPQAFTAPRVTTAGTYSLRVRFSDLDAYAQVDDVQHFEFFQEARVDFLTKLLAEAGHGIDRAPIVIAQTDIEYVEPMTFRTEPYVALSWVARVGGSSFVVEGQVRDGDRVLSRARVVLVTFDPATQRAAPAPEAYRNLLLSELETSA
jgi:acyl-CoA thioester hydrolase